MDIVINIFQTSLLFMLLSITYINLSGEPDKTEHFEKVIVLSVLIISMLVAAGSSLVIIWQ